MSAKTFLNTVFSTKPPELFLLLWEKAADSKTSNWFQNQRPALTLIKQTQGHDIYIGCGVSRENLGPHRRCKMNEIAGVPGLWLDIDILDPAAHKKGNLPKDIDEAISILDVFPLRPTIIVHSGHGLQCWWIFDQFHKFHHNSDNAMAAKRIHDFTFAMRAHARARGFDIDMTFDLARVFRIPGTNNCKTETPIPVTIHQADGATYKHKAIDEAVIKLFNEAPKEEVSEKKDVPSESAEPVRISVSSTEGKDDPKFFLNSEVEPPSIKFAMLLEAEPRFKASWQVKRPEFKDQSPSSYDYSLATFALQAGWSWQETIDLLIAFRRENRLPQKLRYDYYYRTLYKASETIRSSLAEEKIGEILTDIKHETAQAPVRHKEVTQEQAPMLLRNISEVFGVVITRIVRYKTDPPEYRLETPHGNVALGSIQNLIEQSLLRRKIADATKRIIPPVKNDRWQPIAQALLNASVDEDIGEEATERGTVKTWLLIYLQECEPLYDRNDAFVRKRPFFHAGKLHLFGPELRQFMSMYYKEQNTAKTMGRLLKEFGFHSASMAFRRADDDERFITRNVWTITAEHPLVIQFYSKEEDERQGKIEKQRAERAA